MIDFGVQVRKDSTTYCISSGGTSSRHWWHHGYPVCQAAFDPLVLASMVILFWISYYVGVWKVVIFLTLCPLFIVCHSSVNKSFLPSAPFSFSLNFLYQYKLMEFFILNSVHYNLLLCSLVVQIVPVRSVGVPLSWLVPSAFEYSLLLVNKMFQARFGFVLLLTRKLLFSQRSSGSFRLGLVLGNKELGTGSLLPG